jgi:hypothetical protein
VKKFRGPGRRRNEKVYQILFRGPASKSNAGVGFDRFEARILRGP